MGVMAPWLAPFWGFLRVCNGVLGSPDGALPPTRIDGVPCGGGGSFQGKPGVKLTPKLGKIILNYPVLSPRKVRAIWLLGLVV